MARSSTEPHNLRLFLEELPEAQRVPGWTIGALKERIRTEVAHIQEQMLRQVMSNFKVRLEQCGRLNGRRTLSTSSCSFTIHDNSIIIFLDTATFDICLLQPALNFFTISTSRAYCSQTNIRNIIFALHNVKYVRFRIITLLMCSHKKAAYLKLPYRMVYRIKCDYVDLSLYLCDCLRLEERLIIYNPDARSNFNY